MSRPLLLDLFCGAGGAAMGYHRAGFDVVGVDINRHEEFPFAFIQGDATMPPVDLDDFAAVHASPPCQAFTNASNRWRGRGSAADEWPDLIAPIRALIASRPYVIENVPGVRGLRTTILLNGSMFGLKVHRPRLFECSMLLMPPPKAKPLGGQIGVYGQRPDGRRLSNATGQRAAGSLQEAQDAMGMPWADWRGCAEAIPPAYTEFIGRQLMDALSHDDACNVARL